MTRPLDPNDVKNSPPTTEDSAERGFVDDLNRAEDPATYSDLGESDELDPESGDIADEGRGHRG